jgi:hypothetical protein
VANDEANTDELNAFFDGLSPKLRKIVADEVSRQASRLAQEIGAAAPRGSTGQLAASVRVEDGRNDLEKIVVAGGDLTTTTSASGFAYDYALGVEFGTSQMAAEPFFFTTYRTRHDDIVSAIQDAVDRALG